MSVKKYLTLNGLTYFFNKIKTYLTSSTYLNSIGIFPNNDNSVDLGASSKNIKMIYTKGITINGTQFLPSDYVTLSGLSAVATSGSYNDLSNKPTIPTVNNATLTIQKNGTTVKTFTANASSNVTANITVPTKTSDLTNDSGFLTSHQSLSNYSTLANTIKSLSISGKTITYTKGDNTTGTLTTQDNNTWTAMVGATSSSNGSVGYVNAVPPKDGYNTKYLRADGTWQVPPDHTYTVNNATLTIQKNGTTVKTFTANASSNVTCNITVPTKTSDLNNDSGFITGVSWNDVNNKPTLATVATSGSYNDLSNKPTIPSKTSDLTNDSGFITADDTKIPLAGSNAISGDLIPATTDSVNLGSSAKEYLNAYIKSLTINGTACGDILTHNASEFVPRSGGAVMTAATIARVINNSFLNLCGGTNWNNGATISIYGKDISQQSGGVILLHPYDGTREKSMRLYPDGTWTWDGTACQITSDQRYKQQISNIDDKLLDAWEDVDLVQFKYNDAVDTKGKDKARLHTGFVVQQIDSACKEHGIDVSKYGLYCHEEYPEETEEVEVEQEDGTKVKERKVIREASEHYSLRYTEVYAIECAYLRKCIKELRNEIEQLKSSK